MKRKLKVGIVGMGNVGTAIKKEIKQDCKLELIAEFTKENFNTINNYKSKIDIMFLCVGSKSDLIKVAKTVIANFNTIDCFDNHHLMQKYYINMKALAKANNKVAIIGVGWDPGLLSLARAECEMLHLPFSTLWGKGISQGHTQAIKNIQGVKDAIQFTVPQRQKLNKSYTTTDLHKRKCYVVCNAKNKLQIKQQIVNMPSYFYGYKTVVKFVSQRKLKKLKTTKHKGMVVSRNKEFCLTLNINSNPQFTAKVMVAFAFCISKLNSGAYSILDIPMSMLIQNEFKLI